MIAVLTYTVIIISEKGNVAKKFCLHITVVCVRNRQGTVNSAGEYPEMSNTFCLSITSVHLIQYQFLFLYPSFREPSYKWTIYLM